jgi:hypothetical protein
MQKRLRLVTEPSSEVSLGVSDEEPTRRDSTQQSTTQSRHFAPGGCSARQQERLLLRSIAARLRSRSRYRGSSESRRRLPSSSRVASRWIREKARRRRRDEKRLTGARGRKARDAESASRARPQAGPTQSEPKPDPSRNQSCRIQAPRRGCRQCRTGRPKPLPHSLEQEQVLRKRQQQRRWR